MRPYISHFNNFVFLRDLRGSYLLFFFVVSFVTLCLGVKKTRFFALLRMTASVLSEVRIGAWLRLCRAVSLVSSCRNKRYNYEFPNFPQSPFFKGGSLHAPLTKRWKRGFHAIILCEFAQSSTGRLFLFGRLRESIDYASGSDLG